MYGRLPSLFQRRNETIRHVVRTSVMHDHAAGNNPVRLQGELKRQRNEPTLAECPRATPDAHEPHLEAQLDAWEDEGGTPAPR
jgi:hypothetical protein